MAAPERDAFVPANQKQNGAYYTPDAVVRSLLKWGVRAGTDRMLDPACGDGRFIAGHRNSVGIEQDPKSAAVAMRRAPWALVHEGDFFTWAAETPERFDCAVGNPPFIRYQTFKGETRSRAITLCSRLGANFTGLSSSWAPFLVAAASLLKPGGRMAFVVPAEIGHAPYSAPLLNYLVEHFANLHVVAVRRKLFPELSEDCWLLYAEGFADRTRQIRFSAVEAFEAADAPPARYVAVPVDEWRGLWNHRLRPFLMAAVAREFYREAVAASGTRRLGALAQVGIGYVTGANDFFHLRPSEAEEWEIPRAFLHATVRNGRVLPPLRLTGQTVDDWARSDKPILLLRLSKEVQLPRPVRRYLDSEAGQEARTGYKCRTRSPWYVVPDVQVPDFFLTYMSGRQPSLVQNDARCTCTNSVHSVRLRPGTDAAQVAELWRHPIVRLSCELEGHPLGGGMLKLEPGEANRIILPNPADLARLDTDAVEEAIWAMRAWRHYAV